MSHRRTTFLLVLLSVLLGLLTGIGCGSQSATHTPQAITTHAQEIQNNPNMPPGLKAQALSALSKEQAGTPK